MKLETRYSVLAVSIRHPASSFQFQRMMIVQRKKWIGIVSVSIVIIYAISGCAPVEEIPDSRRPRPYEESAVDELERSTAEWAYQQGLQQLDLGAYETAIQYFHLAIERDQRHLRAYLSLGETYSMLNKYLVAETYYNKILQYDPHSVPALTGLGKMHWKLGNHRESLSFFRKVLEIDPNNQFAQQQIEFVTEDLFNLHYDQGTMYKEAGDLNLAATEWQKAHSLSPDDLDFTMELGYVFLEQEDYMMAEGYFQQALGTDPNYLPAILGAGKAKLALQQYHEAIEYFRQAANLRPGDPEVLELLRLAQTERLKSTLPPQYSAIFTAERVTRGDVAALMMVELMLEDRLESSSRLAIISDITTHWAKPYIIKAVQYGIMWLPPDRFFRPNEVITKGELAFVVDALFQQLSLPLMAMSAVSFSDVHPDNRYHDSVIRVYSAGLITANPVDSTFGFNDPVSGEEIRQIFEKIETMIP